MTTTEIVQTKRDEILRIAERHGARNVRVFGSVARGEATENSGAPEKPQMPENRVIKGTDPKPDGSRLVDTIPIKPKA
jgi:hypothetical protein